MGYLTDGLTFNTLRGGNVARLPQFKNKHGQPAHAQANGSDWSLSEWVNATMGEMGELSEPVLMLAMLRALGTVGNATKKLQRGDMTLEQVTELAAKELPDVIIYADLLALRLGLNLGECVMNKFNETSRKVGSSVRLAADDWHHVPGGCDGNHGGPVCEDVNCWKREPHPPVRVADSGPLEMPDPDAYLLAE